MDQTPHLSRPPLAVGRTAEVYAWSEGQVLKLFSSSFPRQEIEREAQIGRTVAATGIGAPAVGDVLTIGDRLGILYSRVDGVSMLERVVRRPWNTGALARAFGQLHAAMHQVHCPQLPAQRRGLLRVIEGIAELPSATRAAVLARLAKLEDNDVVCHGDYHPDNVIMSAAGPVIIDWATASQGNPDADVARTVLMLSLGEPVGRNPVQLGVIALLRRLFLAGYLRSYRSLRPCSQAAIAAWMPVIAAARLSEGIAQETTRLLMLADQAARDH